MWKKGILTALFFACIATVPVSASENSIQSVSLKGLHTSFVQDHETVKLPDVSESAASKGQKPVYTRIDAPDDLYRIEVEDYKGIPENQQDGTKSMEYDRYIRLVSNEDKTVAVEWLFRAMFVYDGKTSYCTDADVIVRNFALRDFVVTDHGFETSGDSAVGSCGAVLKAKGRKYGEKIQIGVTLSGEVHLQ